MRRIVGMFVALSLLPFFFNACNPGSSSDSQVERGSGCPSLAASNETLIFDGLAVAGGWAQASDPDLVRLGNQWYMFFTSIEDPSGSAKLNILGARLPAGSTLDSEATEWEIIGGATPAKIVSVGGSGEWDSAAVETAKYVEGYDNSAGKLVQRIYYTGWQSGTPYSYAVGFSQYSSGTWVKNSTPVLEAQLPFEKLGSSALLGDQTVFYEPGDGTDGAGGTWHMYYQATTDYPSIRTVLIHATSIDGVNWPSAKRSIVNTSPPQTSELAPNGPYHVDVVDIGNRYYFLGWLPGLAQSYATQGLFLTSSSSINGDSNQDDFGKWQALLYGKTGPSWRTLNMTTEALENHTLGLFGSTIKVENNRYWLFYHGVRQDGFGVASIGRAEVDASCLP